jgi:hypothetical protein
MNSEWTKMEIRSETLYLKKTFLAAQNHPAPKFFWERLYLVVVIRSWLEPTAYFLCYHARMKEFHRTVRLL